MGIFGKLFGKKKKEDEIVDKVVEAGESADSGFATKAAEQGLSREETSMPPEEAIQGDGDAEQSTTGEIVEEQVSDARVQQLPSSASPPGELINNKNDAAKGVSPKNPPTSNVKNAKTPLTSTKHEKQSKGFFGKIFDGMKKTASAIGSGISSIFSRDLSDEFYEDLEALLLQSDMGVEAVEEIIDDVRHAAKKQGIKTEEEFKAILAESIANMLENMEFAMEDVEDGQALVLMVVGVNGVGKTTSIGKLAAHYKSMDKKILVAAADTFRAAAADQLETWTKRAGVRLVRQNEGADPGAVVFDAIASAKAKGDDFLIIDTAGRLHNKAHLMEELKKIDRVVSRNWAEASYKKVLVVDATTGQNALNQTEVFNEAVDLDGVILTKLDGTAKGGVVVAIKKKYNLPVLYVGVGEGLDDLVPFDALEFAKGIVGVEG